jgi:hypothetical protein
LTMLDRATDRRCRAGAPVKNLAQSASFHTDEKTAPSNPGIKQLALMMLERSSIKARNYSSG